MTTDEEEGVKVLGVADELLEFGGLLVEVFVLGEEVHGDLVVFVNGAGVQRGFAAGGRGDGDVGVGCEFFVGVGEFGLRGGLVG